MGPNNRQRFYSQQPDPIHRHLLGENRPAKRAGLGRAIVAPAGNKTAAHESGRIGMKKRTPEIESCRVCEEHGDEYRANGKTSNAQRSTLNAQRKQQPRFDLEERLLQFSAQIIEIVDALANTRA